MSTSKLNRERKKEVTRLLCQLEQPEASDTLIVTYQDFLKIRDCLQYYRFNPKVLESLVRLTVGLWRTDKRINRLSLLTKIKQYGFKHEQYKQPIENHHSTELSHQVFQLLRNTFEASEYISSAQVADARKTCNYILVAAKLPDEDVQWLIDNLHLEAQILNRILRYPEKNAIITSWIRDNYESDIFCSRRAEATSWLLDENPEFLIDKNRLIMDVEAINQRDRDAIDEYKSALHIFSMVDAINQEGSTSIDTGDYPSLKLTQRYYSITFMSSKPLDEELPDFKKIFEEIVTEIDYHYRVSMMWSIAYSRLEPAIKMDMLKNYYTEETYFSFINICRRLQLHEVLIWLKLRLDRVD